MVLGPLRCSMFLLQLHYRMRLLGAAALDWGDIGYVPFSDTAQM